ncbi:MAG TPA: EF-P lysine aminoacylase EpmA [Steroidobacteraceae bacterium]|nr:EF-P lysine aminoacylase EpmA [Steroidobacteraceae bacterium]
MPSSRHDWRPTATRKRLEKRAAALAQVRSFFAARGVMEVDTSVVVNAPVTDVHIHSAEVRFPDDATADAGGPARFFLHTSPEFAMKRLLAGGSGDIYQICHVVRGLERGRHHNAEFTLVEWYRLGFTLAQLMHEVDALARVVLGPIALPFASEYLTYREAFENALGIDPLAAPLAELRSAALDLGFTLPAASDGAPRSGNLADSSRDELLDFLMAAHVGPRLGRKALTFIHGYPASQAALARLDPADPRTAQRFELYCEGVELANGFHELASATEQRARFEQDLAERKARGLPVHSLDERLLAALEHGLPDCAGVALGFDRLLMLATGATHIDEVLPFPIDRA